MSPALGRVLAFEDGVVVFDPVSWRYRTMAEESLELLEMLREQIEQGRRSRDELLAALVESMREPGDQVDVALGDSARSDLMDWIDLARHLHV